VRITIRREPSNRPLTMELSLQLLPGSAPLTVAVIAMTALGCEPCDLAARGA
jgi:hypothetical protein